MGYRWAASNAGAPAPTPGQVRSRNERLAASNQLEHTDGAHDFFVTLIAASRQINQLAAEQRPTSTTGASEPDADVMRLARWWSAAHTARAMGGRLHPDGHGVWERITAGSSGEVRRVPSTWNSTGGLSHSRV